MSNLAVTTHVYRCYLARSSRSALAEVPACMSEGNFTTADHLTEVNQTLSEDDTFGYLNQTLTKVTYSVIFNKEESKIKALKPFCQHR
jgi:hypothetical protein